MKKMACAHQWALCPVLRRTPFGTVARQHVLQTQANKRSHRACQSSKRHCRFLVQPRASADVFALDFDGVMVDSEPEVGITVTNDQPYCEQITKAWSCTSFPRRFRHRLWLQLLNTGQNSLATLTRPQLIKYGRTCGKLGRYWSMGWRHSLWCAP